MIFSPMSCFLLAVIQVWQIMLDLVEVAKIGAAQRTEREALGHVAKAATVSMPQLQSKRQKIHTPEFRGNEIQLSACRPHWKAFQTR